ncbi:MAG: cobalamin-binding protein [Chloroflexi bacterium]|nr:cobalamin-binding protein [Chloroflexota bacterium]
MRICSLLPSATEIVCALGLADQLVAVTHECDFPPEAAGKPVVTYSPIHGGNRSSGEIDSLVHQHLHEHRSLYHLDLDLLRQLEPDLILTQELCEVCAVSYAEVQSAVRVLDGSPRLVSLEPKRLADVLDNVRLVGDLTGAAARATELVEQLQARIDRVSQITEQVDSRPRVFALEWLDPPFAAGHWVPEQIRLAGGTSGIVAEGEPSRQVTWDEIAAFDPQVLVLMPCGFDVERTKRETHLVTDQPQLADLAAARDRRVWMVDANSYFSRPGPRLVDGLETLAWIVHPESFAGWMPEGAAEPLPLPSTPPVRE